MYTDSFSNYFYLNRLLIEKDARLLYFYKKLYILFYIHGNSFLMSTK